MNELIFYTGTILSAVFFVASAILFIYKKIPSVVGYLLKIGKIKIGDKGSNTSAPLSIEAMNAKLKSQTSEQTNLLHESDDSEYHTSVLSEVEKYAEALLDADCTSLLPKL